MLAFCYQDYLTSCAYSREDTHMTKSWLINALAQQSHLGHHDVELVISTILEHMSRTLASGERIEVRNFGSFNLRYRSPRTGRNPATGQPVEVGTRYALRFKPGMALRERVNALN